jgi:hypothetical protein
MRGFHNALTLLPIEKGGSRFHRLKHQMCVSLQKPVNVINAKFNLEKENQWIDSSTVSNRFNQESSYLTNI